MDAGLALQAALHAALVGDGELVALLGGARVHDRPPRGAAHPFVAFGAASDRRLDGDLPPLREHRLALDIHSTAEGRREAAAIAARIEAVLTGAALFLDGHRLVSLTVADRAMREARDRRSVTASLSLRAVTEVAQ